MNAPKRIYGQDNGRITGKETSKDTYNREGDRAKSARIFSRFARQESQDFISKDLRISGIYSDLFRLEIKIR